MLADAAEDHVSDVDDTENEELAPHSGGIFDEPPQLSDNDLSSTPISDEEGSVDIDQLPSGVGVVCMPLYI